MIAPPPCKCKQKKEKTKDVLFLKASKAYPHTTLVAHLISQLGGPTKTKAH